MKGKKIVKIIGIILLLLFIVLLIHTIRNYIIVSGLQNNISKFADSTNYHVKITSYGTEKNTNNIMNYYKKNDKVVAIVESNIEGKNMSKLSTYIYDGKTDTFVEGEGVKFAQLGEERIGIIVQIYNSLENESPLQTFWSSIFAHISSEKVGDKDCYVVSNYDSSLSMEPVGDSKQYIEKDTGLLIKDVTNGIVSEREFEFDNVDDSIFIEPDISEYEIVK